MGRQARVNVRAVATTGLSTPNSLATSFRTKTSRKKSKASRVQPRKLAVTARFSAVDHPLRAVIAPLPRREPGALRLISFIAGTDAGETPARFYRSLSDT